MNKFEKKALAKRAYRALVKRAAAIARHQALVKQAWSPMDLFRGKNQESVPVIPPEPEVSVQDAPKSEMPIELLNPYGDTYDPINDLPNRTSENESLYNRADPNSVRYKRSDGTYWEPDYYPDERYGMPTGLIPALAANTETFTDSDGILRSAAHIPLPRDWEERYRPYGPLLNGDTARIMARNIEHRAWKANPDYGYNIMGNPWLEQMALNYYPQFKARLSQERSRSAMPASITLNDEPLKFAPGNPEIIPNPTSPSPKSTSPIPAINRHQRSLRMQQQKPTPIK